MNKLYIAPELKVVCFGPVEKIAVDVGLDFDDLLNIGGELNEQPGASIIDGDISVDL